MSDRPPLDAPRARRGAKRGAATRRGVPSSGALGRRSRLGSVALSTDEARPRPRAFGTVGRIQ